jgi:putative SOS response-associated peptidase YedK
MCGRYVLAAGLDEIAAYFSGIPAHEGLWTWEPNWNLAPAIVAPVVALNGKGERSLVPMRWGLHPHWRKEMPEGRPLFNARSETAFEKASFRTPWKRRRALVPTNGWYEWEGVTSPKTPFYITPKENGLTAFAGLWDQWRVDEGITLLSFTILTTPANGPVKHLHHRMPVRLPKDKWSDWLDPDVKPEKTIERMLTGNDLEFHEVSKAASSGRAQGPNLILKTVD